MAKAEKASGEERFEQYYGEIYGSRWPVLREALLKEANPVSLSEKLKEPYYMDKASILAASMLPISENNTVLDMCAAPGGKTLSIALRLNGKGKLISNDRSASRRNRLISVLDTCLSPELRAIVKVTGHDSTTWSLHEKDAYDRILLDAPCSSERPLQTRKHLPSGAQTGQNSLQSSSLPCLQQHWMLQKTMHTYFTARARYVLWRMR